MNLWRARTWAAVVATLAFLALPAVVPAGLAAEGRAQPSGGQGALARIELTGMSPRVVTTTGPGTLVVGGRVVNTSDRVISELVVRVQRDEPLGDDQSADAAVRDVPDAPYLTRFTALDAELQPGQSAPFELTVPLSGGDLDSLQIAEPGVYPLLVNVNGTPDFGNQARLASVPLLLPVLGVPPAGPGGTPSGPVPPAPRPPELTVLWPLVASPARMPTLPGEPIMIASPTADSDPIADEIAPGGRLDGLVTALLQVVAPGSPLASAVCVAVDPELLQTVSGMTGGYRVWVNGRVVDGTGDEAARRWLNRLRQVVDGRCVLPLPYGDPDLVAMSAAGLSGLEEHAVDTGRRLVRELLGVQPLDGLTWPVRGLITDRALNDLTELGQGGVLLEPRALANPPVTDDVAGVAGPTPTTALLADPVLTAALAPAAPAPVGADGEPTVATRPTGTDAPLAAQDGIGGLVYRATAATQRPVLVTPPRRWQANETEAAELLRVAQLLVDGRYAVPRPLPSMLAAQPVGAPSRLNYPAGATGLPSEQVSAAARTANALNDLEASTSRDATVDLEPAELMRPLRQAVLRSLSTAWHVDPSRGRQQLDAVEDRFASLRRSVRIVPPNGPYTLASSDAPLLVTVRNELPVTVSVRLSLVETSGLRAEQVGVQSVPARSNRQLVIPAEVKRSGQFTVDAWLTTPAGGTLGPPTTLHVRSTAFGTITVALTAGAGAVLVVLVGRRLVRRIRNNRQESEAG